jgi:hypothetical protein
MVVAIRKEVDNTLPWNLEQVDEDGPYIVWNSAEVRGAQSAAFDALMEQNVRVTLGNQYVKPYPRGKRSTAPGEWVAIEGKWRDLAEGAGPSKENNREGWGLTTHWKGDRKDGMGYVLGVSANGSREKLAMREMAAIGLDLDEGTDIEAVARVVDETGWACFLYTSYNHMKTTIDVSYSAIHALAKGEPFSDELVRAHLHQKKPALGESFIEHVTIREEKVDIGDGFVVRCDCPPIHKMRLIFPFSEPINIAELDDDPAKGPDVWKAKVKGLAAKLGVHHDRACEDPSRLFYTARHRPEDGDFECIVFRGAPLAWEDIPSSAGDPWSQAGQGRGGSSIPEGVMFGDVSVTDLYRHYGMRWNIADMLEGTDAHIEWTGTGKSHVDCAYRELNHTDKAKDRATIAVNAADSHSGFAVVSCEHESCKTSNNHIVYQLKQWLEDGVLTVDMLEDPTFMEPLPDSGEETFMRLTPAELEEEQAAQGDKAQGFEARASEFTMDANESDVVSFIAEAHEAEIVDKGIRGRINATIAKQTTLKLDEVRSIWTTLDREAQTEERKKIAEARRKSAPSPYIPLEDATEATVEHAAQNAAWLPPFVSYKAGWFWAVDFDKPDAGPKRICRAFEVPHVAFGETEVGRTNEITIRYRHRSAQRGIVESTYRIGDTYRDTGSFVSRLVDEGFETDPQAKTEMLVMLLRAVNTDNEAVLVEKAGWHGDTYVSPTGTVIGGNVRYILNPKARVSGRTAGTLADHHRYATTALTGANGQLLLPGYLSGLVGCLVDFIENDVSPVVAMEGDSTTGKTTAGKMGAAHFAPPDNTGLFMKADQTATATENNAERANGSVLVLDEGGSSKLDAGEKQRLILQWADGSGRGRGTRDAGVQRTRTWRTCFVTGAERTLLNRLTAEGADPLTGAVARVFSVNFDGANTLEDGSDDLAAIRALSGDDRDAAIYGVTGPVFAEKLAGLGRDVVRSRVSGVADEWADLGPGAARRVVRLAALFCVAGEIAQEAGIFSSEVPVKEHMQALLEATLDARMTHLDTDRQQLEALRRAIRRGVQTGDIVSMHDSEDYNRRERLGYYGHLTENGRPDDSAAKKMQDPETAMRARTYILPEDRLSKLGITTGHKALTDRLRDVGALVERRKGERMQAFHDYIPGEGKGRNIRVTGEFVHGKED